MTSQHPDSGDGAGRGDAYLFLDICPSCPVPRRPLFSPSFPWMQEQARTRRGWRDGRRAVGHRVLCPPEIEPPPFPSLPQDHRGNDPEPTRQGKRGRRGRTWPELGSNDAESTYRAVLRRVAVGRTLQQARRGFCGRSVGAASVPRGERAPRTAKQAYCGMRRPAVSCHWRALKRALCISTGDAFETSRCTNPGRGPRGHDVQPRRGARQSSESVVVGKYLR